MEKRKPLKYKGRLRVDFVREVREKTQYNSTYEKDSANKLYSLYPFLPKKMMRKFVNEFFRSLIELLLLDNKIRLMPFRRIRMAVGSNNRSLVIKSKVVDIMRRRKERNEHRRSIRREVP
jgi:hypothetical protein